MVSATVLEVFSHFELKLVSFLALEVEEEVLRLVAKGTALS